MTSLWTWISGSFTGLMKYLRFSRKSGKICLIGLDNAGKTSLLHVLKYGTMRTHDPTWKVTKEELSFGGINITIIDLGGHEQMRRAWKNYFYAVDAIVFLVDASDRQRFHEVRIELESILDISEDFCVPILLLGNKIDGPMAVSEDELLGVLGLYSRTTGKAVGPRSSGPQPLELFMCSVLKNQGYGEGLRWLMSYV